MKKKRTKKIVFLLLTNAIPFAIMTNVNAKTFINIDSPSTSNKYTNNIDISGWVMSDEAGSNVKLYVDGNELTSINRIARPDVLNAIHDYGTKDENPTPGYTASIDLTKYSYGKHEFKVVVVNQNGKVISNVTRNFERKTPSTFINIDSPSTNQKYVNTLDISGWVMSEETNSDVKLYIDNNEIESVNRVVRPDVLNAIHGYGTSAENPTPGYTASIDLTKYSYGKHELKVSVINQNGKVISNITRNFEIRRPNTFINIDSPKTNQKSTNDFYVSGWVMSEEANSNVKLYVDNDEVTSVNRITRPDVLNAIHDYGTKDENPTPGYNANIDLTKYSYGKHEFKVVVVNQNGSTISSISRTFERNKPKTFINLDYPKRNGNYQNDLTISGWVMSGEKNSSVKLYVDNNEVLNVSRIVRPDVLNAIHDYGTSLENPTPGYAANVDLTKYTYGKHTVTIKVQNSRKETISETSVNFNNQKPNYSMYIDSPASNIKQNRNLYIQGWVMSSAGNTNIKLSIDDNEVTSSINRIARPDVINSVHGYGTINENPTPGFVGNIDLSGYKDGKHVITIGLYSSIGEKITEKNITINLEKYNSYLNISSPTNNSVNKTSINIEGDALTEANDGKLMLYLDGRQIDDSLITRSNDANIDTSKYGGADLNKTPKFSLTYDTSKIVDGSHTLEARIVTSNGEIIKSNKVNFTIKKYTGQMYMDSPWSSNINKNNNLFISGWRMSEDANDHIEVYIDDTKLNNLNYVDRPDVLNAITGYGGRNTNFKPGYEVTVPASNFSIGHHLITVKDINNIGEVITSMTKHIYIYDKIMFGIDVSEFQGNINWNSVKSSQAVDFAYIRFGFRGYGSAGRMVKDSTFNSNFKNASNAGIKTGIYFFSQATNYQEGVEEANYIISDLRISCPDFMSRLKLPIAIDIEPSGHGNGRADVISARARTDAIRGFADQLRKFGIIPAIYISPSYMFNRVYMNELNDIDVWLAHWTYNPSVPSSYSGKYVNWQYSNSGAIPGINGRVDLNISYKMY